MVICIFTVGKGSRNQQPADAIILNRIRRKIMAKELVEARYQLKDENGNSILDEEGKATYAAVEVEYDFGDNLDQAVEACGEDVVFSNFKANAKVALQGIMRTKHKGALTPDQIQAVVDAWKPGMVSEKVTVDPATAIQNAFATWSDEKKATFLASLGVQA